MTIEPTYEPVDEQTGEELRSTANKLMKDALTPDPAHKPLAVKMLAVSRARMFANTAERSRWYALEKKATGESPDQRLFRAWLENCIAWGVKQNRPVVKMPYTSVIALAENESAARNWQITNRSRVLRKPAVSEVKEVLEAKEKELDILYNED